MTRILFVSLPATGHLMPLVPLAEATVASGHAAAFAVHRELAPRIPAGIDLLAAGGTLDEGIAEVQRRGFPHPAQPGPGAVEMFAGAVVDLGFEATLDRARAFGPDLIIGERFAFLAPLVADALEVPWAAVAISGGLPDELAAAFDARLAGQYAERAIAPTVRRGLLDPYPELLHRADPEWVAPGDRIPIRSTAPAPAGDARPLARSGRPTALITFGTSVQDPEALAAVVRSTLDAGFDAVVTEDADALPGELAGDRLRAVGFTPLGRLLPAVDAVVTPGGTGTMLAALAAGVPLVMRPVLADHPFNADRIARLGLGVQVDGWDAVGDGLRRVTDDSRVAAAVADAARVIAAIEPPAAGLQRLLSLI